MGPWIVDTIRFFSVIYMETIRSFAALLVQSTNYNTKRHTDNNKLVAQLEWHRQDNLNQNISVVFLFMFYFLRLFDYSSVRPYVNEMAVDFFFVLKLSRMIFSPLSV